MKGYGCFAFSTDDLPGKTAAETSPILSAKTAKTATEGNPGLPTKKNVAVIRVSPSLYVKTPKIAAAAEASSSLSAKTITEGKLGMAVNANGKLSMPATAKVKLSPPQFEQRSRPPHTLLQGNIRTTLPSIQLPQGVKRISERALTDLVKGTVCTLAFKPQDQKIPEKDATTLILLIPIMMSTSELGSIN